MPRGPRRLRPSLRLARDIPHTVQLNRTRLHYTVNLMEGYGFITILSTNDMVLDAEDEACATSPSAAGGCADMLYLGWTIAATTTWAPDFGAGDPPGT